MSQFEYLGIAFGLLYTVAALRLLRALPYALRPGVRDWLHGGYVIAVLIGLAVNFWKFGALRTVDWTLQRFLLALSLPGTLYVVTATLVPDDPDEVVSWREHFMFMRRPFYMALLATGLVMFGHSLVLLDRPPEPAQAALILIGLVGLASRNIRILALLLATQVGFMAADLLLTHGNPWL